MRVSELSKLPLLVKECVTGPIMNTDLKNFPPLARLQLFS